MIKFSKFILFQTVIIFLMLLFPILSWGIDYVKEILCAFLLSTINVMVGYYLVIDSFAKKNADFYKTVYGGMLARMVFIFGFTIFMINSSYLESIPFVLSLMFFYVIHQWTEISFWLKNLEGKTIEV
tara:strand:- start:68 stop:448 length:381 start_codon:yes stop_codon:yes gene_type:complete